MTESQQPKQPAKKAASPHRKVLEGAFSPAVVDAIDGRIKEVSLETLAEVKQQLVDLIEEHKRTIAEINAMPASPERDRAVAAAKEASAEVKAAGTEVNEVLAQERAGQPAASEQVQQAGESVERAKESVKQSSEEVSRQLSALKEQGDAHQAILAVEHDGKRPDSRLDAIEKDVADLKAWKGGADERIEGAQDTANRAWATARASASSDHALRRGSTWALIVFVTVFVLYLLIWGLTGLDWTLRDQFAWPFGLAALAFFVGVITATAARAEASAFAESEAGHHGDGRRSAGLGIFRDRHHDHDEDRSSGASASADARANSR